MRSVNRTYSIPEAKEKLRRAYLESNNDPEEKAVYRDFECTMNDGLDESKVMLNQVRSLDTSE